jgi:hypothetical protein
MTPNPDGTYPFVKYINYLVKGIGVLQFQVLANFDFGSQVGSRVP